MSANVKIGNNTIPNATAVKLESADTAGTYVTFVDSSSQPTLFAPTVVTGANTISWSNNSLNGGFSPTITGKVNGNTVSSPLAVTQEMDGQTLTVEASLDGFNSSTSTTQIAYMTPSVHSISVSARVSRYAAVQFASSDLTFVGQDSNVSTQAIALIPYGFTGQTTISELVVIESMGEYQVTAIMVGGVGSSIGVNPKIAPPYQYHSESPKITGSVVIENVTRGSSMTYTFNNSYMAQQTIPSGWAVGDSVKFTINY